MEGDSLAIIFGGNDISIKLATLKSLEAQSSEILSIFIYSTNLFNKYHVY